MRTAMIGGSFDPVHIGHLFLAAELQRELGYQRIVFVPANLPPHKRLSNWATAEQRIEMLRLAVAPFEEYEADDAEIVRGGVSYTLDTIPLIAARHNAVDKLGLLIGDDLVGGFGEWKGHADLAAIVDIVVAHRAYVGQVPFDYPHRYLDNLVLPISSSEIRERVRTGRAYRHIVPDAVFRYIDANMLYRQRA